MIKRWLRKIFMCGFLCGGKIDHDDIGVFWKCERCGKVRR